MIIKNGFVFTESGLYEKKDIFLQDGRIVASQEEVTDQTTFDAEGLKVLPALIDIHTHGTFGHDFCDKDYEGLKIIAKHQKEKGIGAFCPTSMTLPESELTDIFKTILQDFPEDCADIVGINMEGPYLSPKKKGAHVEEYITPCDIESFRRLNKLVNGKIKLVTVAPEMPGAAEFIEAMKDAVSISVGHTTADYDMASKAFLLGSHHVTHLYNAMPPFAHRAPGVIGAACDNTDVFVEIICDGYHIHPSVIRTTYKMFGAKRMVLISDSMMATDLEDGNYELGGQAVTVKDKLPTLADGTIAGSGTNLFDCMKKAISFGIPEEDAIFMVTRNPAKSIGIYDELGSITPGKRANIILVDKHMNLVKSI